MEERSPWISIWTRPRATIARIVEHNPNQCLWRLATIYGFCSLLNMFQSMTLGAEMTTLAILGLALIAAPFYGWLYMSFWSGIVSFVGKWFKGRGHFTAIRSAYAWSCVPLALNIPLWALMVALFGHQLFLNLPNANTLPMPLMILLFAVLVSRVVLAIWSLVIYLNALAEVQHFSMLRAILNVIVSGVILSVILFVFWNLLTYFLV